MLSTYATGISVQLHHLPRKVGCIQRRQQHLASRVLAYSSVLVKNGNTLINRSSIPFASKVAISDVHKPVGIDPSMRTKSNGVYLKFCTNLRHARLARSETRYPLGGGFTALRRTTLDATPSEPLDTSGVAADRDSSSAVEALRGPDAAAAAAAAAGTVPEVPMAGVDALTPVAGARGGRDGIAADAADPIDVVERPTRRGSLATEVAPVERKRGSGSAPESLTGGSGARGATDIRCTSLSSSDVTTSSSSSNKSFSVAVPERGRTATCASSDAAVAAVGAGVAAAAVAPRWGQ